MPQLLVCFPTYRTSPGTYYCNINTRITIYNK